MWLWVFGQFNAKFSLLCLNWHRALNSSACCLPVALAHWQGVLQGTVEHGNLMGTIKRTKLLCPPSLDAWYFSHLGAEAWQRFPAASVENCFSIFSPISYLAKLAPQLFDYDNVWLLVINTHSLQQGSRVFLEN